jgi:hypothetical protein
MTNQLIDTGTGPIPDPHALWANGRRRRQSRHTAMLSAGTVGAMAVVAVAVAVPFAGRSARPASDVTPSTLPAATLATSSRPVAPSPVPTTSVAAQLQALVAAEVPAGSINLLDPGATHELPPIPVPKADVSSALKLLGASYYALPGETGAVTLAAVQVDPSMTLAQIADLYGIAAKPGETTAVSTSTAYTSDQNGWQVVGVELAANGRYAYVHYDGPSKASLGSVDATTLLDETVKALSGS